MESWQVLEMDRNNYAKILKPSVANLHHYRLKEVMEELLKKSVCWQQLITKIEKDVTPIFSNYQTNVYQILYVSSDTVETAVASISLATISHPTSQSLLPPLPVATPTSSYQYLHSGISKDVKQEILEKPPQENAPVNTAKALTTSSHYSPFRPRLEDDGLELLQSIFPTPPPFTAQYFPPNFNTLPDPHGSPGLILQPRELFAPSGSPAYNFSPSSSRSLTLDPQVGSPTPAVEDLLDDTPEVSTPEVSEVSHILIIYKLLLINIF